MRKIVGLVLAVEIGALAVWYLHCCHAAGPYGFPLDDSWIHAHLARNIAEGKGIVYNPGQHVTSTAMLYSVLLAGLCAISSTPIFNAMALGLALHMGGALLVYMTARRLSVSPALSLAAAVFFAAIPRLVWGALSGMEIPLYVFLVCLGIYWHVRYQWQDGARVYLASLAFGLAALARPECTAFLACSLAERLISYVRFERGKRRMLGFLGTIPIHVAVFVAVIAPVVALNLASYGRPLPPAFYAKTRAFAPNEPGGRLAAELDKTYVFLSEAATVSYRDNAILYFLLIPGMIACVALSRKASTSGALILPFGLIFLPVATALAASTGPHRSLAQLLMQNGRYSAYLCPLLVLIAVLGLAGTRSLVDLIGRVRPWLGRAVVGIALVAVALTLARSNWSFARRYAMEVQNINDMQVTLGKWAARLPKDTVVAVNDAGAIAYFSRLSILDTVGVVNPEVVPYLNKHRSRQPGLLEYLRERKPAYVIIFPTWYPRIARRDDILHPVKSIKLRRNVICGGPEMVVYRATWQ